MNTRVLLALALAGSLVACDDDKKTGEDAGSQDQQDAGTQTDAHVDDVDAHVEDVDAHVEPGPTCSTTVTPAAGGATWVKLCELDGPVRHVKITGIVAAAAHASSQFFLGFDAQPAGSQSPIAADQWKLMLYGGGPGGAPSPQLQATFGTDSAAMDGDHAFINAASTICFDVLDGSASAPPRAIVWVDGARGADCDDAATLTVPSAQGIAPWYGGSTGAIAKDRDAWYYQSAGNTTSPVVSMSTTAVLDDATLAATSDCTTTWQSNVDRQQLCRPAAGAPVRYTLANVSSTTNSKYFYLILGEDQGVTTTPTTAAGDGRFVFTGGRANGAPGAGVSWTYFRFNGGSSTQFEYAAGDPASPLYTAQPSTVCLEIHDVPAVTTPTPIVASTRVYFWATGANGANCADVSTLTAANVLYDSSTDTTGTSNYLATRADGKSDFIKISGSDTTNSATFGTTTVSMIPAIR